MGLRAKKNDLERLAVETGEARDQQGTLYEALVIAWRSVEEWWDEFGMAVDAAFLEDPEKRLQGRRIIPRERDEPGRKKKPPLAVTTPALAVATPLAPHA